MQDANANQRKPNSVLFSLKELRKVERQRVQQEEQQQQRQQRQQQQAAEEAEQNQQQEARRREEQLQQQQEQRLEQQQRQQREDQLRLEEAERRARVEAEMQLELERQRLEQARRGRGGRGAGWIPTVLVVVLLGVVAGYLGYALHNESARAHAAAGQLRQVRDRSARLERSARQIESRMSKQVSSYASRITALEHALADARRPAAAPAKVPASPHRPRPPRRRPGKKNTKTHFKLCLDSDDPLSCIGKGKPGSR